MLWSVGVKSALQADGQMEDVVLGRRGVAKELRVPYGLRDRMRTDINVNEEENYVIAEDIDDSVYAIVDELGVLTSRGQSAVVSVFFVTTPVPAMVLQLLEGSIFMETNPDQVFKISSAGDISVRHPSETLHIISVKDLYDTLQSVIRYRYNVDMTKAASYLDNFLIEVRFESVQQTDAEPFLRTMPTKFYTALGLNKYDFSEFENGVYIQRTPEMDEMDEAEDEDPFDPYEDAEEEDFDEEDRQILKDMEQ